MPLDRQSLVALKERIQTAREGGPDLDEAIIACLTPEDSVLATIVEARRLVAAGRGREILETPSTVMSADSWATNARLPGVSTDFDRAFDLIQRVMPGAYGGVDFGGSHQNAQLWERHHWGEPWFGTGRRPSLAMVAALVDGLIVLIDRSLTSEGTCL